MPSPMLLVGGTGETDLTVTAAAVLVIGLAGTALVGDEIAATGATAKGLVADVLTGGASTPVDDTTGDLGAVWLGVGLQGFGAGRECTADELTTGFDGYEEWTPGPGVCGVLCA